MPFKSEAQRRFLWANRPDIAKRWANEPGAKNKGLPYHKKEASMDFLDSFFYGLDKLAASHSRDTTAQEQAELEREIKPYILARALTGGLTLGAVGINFYKDRKKQPTSTLMSAAPLIGLGASGLTNYLAYRKIKALREKQLNRRKR